ncbi:MAG: nucleotidyltransferase family protein [Rhodobacteraceae bacterium]|nr:nucleotidyltransferase family protein [Paracoccaceae bacterium]
MKLIPAETTILLLAAGQSSRMGTADKLLQTIRDQPLLGRVARMCLDAGVAKVAAVLRPGDDRRRAVLPAGVEIVENPEFAEGMASSIRAGLKAVARDTRAVVVVLADMPDVSASDIRALVAAFDPDQGKTICRAMTVDGAPGNPVLFGREHFADLAALRGDKGANAFLKANPGATRLVPTHGENARTDLDTPLDWADYLKRS